MLNNKNMRLNKPKLLTMLNLLQSLSLRHPLRPLLPLAMYQNKPCLTKPIKALTSFNTQTINILLIINII